MLTETGINLLTLAARESSDASPFSSSSTSHFSRHLFVDGMTYLLRALPEDLSEEESLRLRTALPAEIMGDQLAVVGPGQSLATHSQDHVAVEESGTDVSMIHRFFAFITVQLFLIIHFLLPHAKVFAGQIYRYERENHISERLLRSSLDTIDNVGQRSMQIADAVCKLNDGKVGQAMQDFGSWWIQGMVGGLHEGIGEGLAIVGATQSSPHKVCR